MSAKSSKRKPDSWHGKSKAGWITTFSIAVKLLRFGTKARKFTIRSKKPKKSKKLL